MTERQGQAGLGETQAPRSPQNEEQAPLRMHIPAGRDPNDNPPGYLPPRRYRGDDIGNRPRRRVIYTTAMVLDELRRVAVLVAPAHLTISLFRRHSRMATAVVHRRFGLWRTALEHAGLADRYSGCPITDKLRRRPSVGMSNDDLLAELRAIAAAHGGDTVTVKQVATSPRVSLTVYYCRFGSFAAAVAAAGLRQTKRARRYSDALCFANLAALARHYGRMPLSGELDKPPSTVSMQGYRLRYGSVRRAFALFAMRANAAGADPPLAPPDPKTAALLMDEQRRDVRGSLRFQVMQRDRFRCVACGNSPATDLACKLHVDHIEPFSKGGRSRLDNLRTLCAACNWSRGNRVEEAGAGP